MAARVRSADLLPEIFRTDTNKKFLSATLDQLVQPSKLQKIEGFIGRTIGPGVDSTDKYIIEPDKLRSDYQLEPAVVYKKANSNTTKSFITYPGIIDALKLNGAKVNRHDRLFSSEYYSWDPFVDYDKFVNFSQYYWLAGGPSPVDVSATEINLTDTFVVTRNTSGYTLSDQADDNPTITLIKGGNYTFSVAQTGHRFYIQTDPGTSGVVPGQENISSRSILGISNNGDDNGNITFNVPVSTAQNFYFTLTDLGDVDLATTLRFDQINNVYVDEFISEHNGIDQITDLDGRTVIFLDQTTGNENGWQVIGQFDNVGYDSETFNTTTDITVRSQRYSVWQIQYVYDVDGDSTNPYMVLRSILNVPNLNKLQVQFGTDYSNLYFYKNAEGFFEQQPHITVLKHTLYYQDADDESLFGIIKLVDESKQLNLNVDEDIVGAINYTSPNGITFTNGLKVKFRGITVPGSYQDKEYYIEGVGVAIQLLAVEDFQTPETYTNSETLPFDLTGYDEGVYDASLNAPKDLDYFTINRASRDQNPWSRSNRWVHVDVINKTAEYNNFVATTDQAYRAKRPILEFKANLRLFNFGTQGKNAIDIFDFDQTDAFSNVNGQNFYATDGYTLVDGSRIIFTNDSDPAVKNKIYEVQLIDPDDTGSTKINLISPSDSAIANDEIVYCLSGNTTQGKSLFYNGIDWIESQQKTKVNQPPLFDLYDANGVEFNDITAYPSSNFIGTKLFSYAVGTGAVDPVLGQKLSYYNINNIGDIIFDNNFEKDTFIYTQNSTSKEENINIGFARRYSSRTLYDIEIGWKKHLTKSSQAQVFAFVADETPLVCDIAASDEDNAVIIYIQNELQAASKYTFTKTSSQTTITFVTEPTVGSNIQVNIISDQASDTAHYDIPLNLNNNSINGIFETVTLGTIRNHYVDLAEHISDLTGTVLGNNNIRDLGEVIHYGNQIVRQGSPLQLAATFVKAGEINFFTSLDFSALEYEKFKTKLLDAITTQDFLGATTANKLDQAIEFVNLGKQSSRPFFWSDMIPHGQIFTETTYTVTVLDDDIFNTSQLYDYTTANYKALSVYVNDIILTKDYDYTVSVDALAITISIDLAIGDVITLREYKSTAGSYIPNTPTKLGLYDKYKPEKFEDMSYVTATNVILGHDGSVTVAFDDDRDLIILEFETRMFNNLKVQSDIPLHYQDVMPGKFRTTDYTQKETTEILATSFLNWAAWNRLDYKSQDYDANNEYTWNYSSATDSIGSELLLGHWRGIYHYFYDTDRPDTHPWQMLGFSQQPSWWTTRYGPAPYTSGNTVLWDDIEQGKIWNHTTETYTVDDRYIRSGLSLVLPVDDDGDLRSPFVTLVKNYDSLSFKKSWVVGDAGPVETAWKRSSQWPFAVQRLLALTKPAEYFALNIDRDLYKYDDTLEQYLYDGRSHIQSQNVEVYGDGVIIKHSYVNWCVDYVRRQGINTSVDITDALANINIQLTYRMASFSDKEYLKIFTEKSSPDSLNTSLLLPDESYEIFLYKNEIFDTVNYTSVIVQKLDKGYAVYGNSRASPHFTIRTSIPNGNYHLVTVGSTTVRISKDFNNILQLVPYGHIFSSVASLADFLNSYGKYLEGKGFIFEQRENNYNLDWQQMISEFIYWSQQAWQSGSVINLNPGASKLVVEREKTLVAPLLGNTIDDIILDANLQPISNNLLLFDRTDNRFSIGTTNEAAIAFVSLKFTSYEHVLIFDNKSIFNDLIYDPVTGLRQHRLRVVGYNTADWNGQIEAQGFIFNIDNVEGWSGNNTYSKGDIVLFKNRFYCAAVRIQPSEKFDYTLWLETEYDSIKKGLLPNLSLKADQTRQFYDKNSINLEKEASLLSFGLIGFKPREYMQAMNLDDASQVGIYSNFLGNKGTLRATDLFKSARLKKELTDYSISENWAVKYGTYGATANRSSFELQLDESLLVNNPSIIEIIANNGTGTSDQNVKLSDIFKQSYTITPPMVLPLVNFTTTEQNLPTAGYVNIDDVDMQTFDFAGLDSRPVNGSILWIAKDNSYDWNIYRMVITSSRLDKITSNLNGYCTFEFSNHHGLSENDLIVIKSNTGVDNLDAVIDGAYKVKTVGGLTKVTVLLTLTGRETRIDAVNGLMYNLRTVRVDDASQIANLTFVSDIVSGDRVWVDDNGLANWQVLTKTAPFTVNSSVVAAETTTTPKFGCSIAQSANNLTQLVGASGYQSGNGAVYTFLKDINGDIVENYILTLGATQTAGYGGDVDFGEYAWGIAGAAQSNNGQGYAVIIKKELSNNTFNEWQLLTSPTDAHSLDEFGYSVAISKNEKWAFVGSPGATATKVHVYQRIDNPTQSVVFTSDATTSQFDIGGLIQVDSAAQLSVVINNVELAANEYSLGGTNINLNVTPLENVKVTRRSEIFYTGDGSSEDFDITSLYTVGNSLNSLTVYVDGVIQRPKLDYDYSYDSALSFSFVTAPVDAAVIRIKSSDYFSFVTTITNPGSSNNRFGHSISTSADGRQVVIGAIDEPVDGLPGVGTSYVYDRDVQKFQISDSADLTYVVAKSILGRAEIYVNSAYQLDSDYNIGGTYTWSGTTITLANSLSIGDFLEVGTNNWMLITELPIGTASRDAEYGYDVKICPLNGSAYISAPYADSVTRYVNQGKLYGTITGTVANPTVTPGHKIRINNFIVTLTGATLNSVVSDINNADIPNVIASASANKLTIGLITQSAGEAYNKLNVLPAGSTTSPLTNLGLSIYKLVQTIVDPDTSHNRFGHSIDISNNATVLTIGAPKGDARRLLTLDVDTTTLDENATRLLDITVESGSTYTFEYLTSASDSILTPGKFVFGQQLSDTAQVTAGGFGTAVSYRSNKLLVTSTAGIGRLSVFDNPGNQSSWLVTREQAQVVNTDLINSVCIYDKNSKLIKSTIDFIDPLQGKILGVARQNIDIISAVDPAGYNQGSVNNYGMSWGQERVGEIWWNLDNCRFIDYYQGDKTYSAKRWGQLFPGSTVDIFQWIESNEPPGEYTGDGTPIGTLSYSMLVSLTNAGIIATKYYFWVKDMTSVSRQRNKTLSTRAIAQYIENPKSSGIPYIALIDASTMALTNVNQYLTVKDSILSIEFDNVLTENNIHVEYELIKTKDPTQFLSTSLYRKFIDSMGGADSLGNRVPDPMLSEGELYGIDYRPRQGMFKNRQTALKNYINRANRIFALYPMVEIRSLDLLNTADLIPAAGTAWDKTLLSYDELTYQNLALVSAGYKYLVLSDSSNNNLWTIYTVLADKSLSLTLLQNYKTSNYWSYKDWYADGYSSIDRPVLEVTSYSLLTTAIDSVELGQLVKVTINGNGKFEIYARTLPGWERVGLEDGTIEISSAIYTYSTFRFGFDLEVFDSQYFAQEPLIETRQIIKAINEELFIDNLANHRIDLIILMFEYVMSEQPTADWLIKTSLIDVSHTLRELKPFKMIQRDNQNFVEDYLNEVKPYHVQIKEFSLIYKGDDTFSGDATDFDLPVYYNKDLDKFVSPQLQAHTNGLGAYAADDLIWINGLYSSWKANYTLSIESINMISGGSGYTVPPTVTVTGTATTTAIMVAIVNTSGSVIAVEIKDGGAGYTTTPTIGFTGGNGSGAEAVVLTTPGAVRSFKTVVKYDRCEYVTSVVDWESGEQYVTNQLVRYNNKVYKAIFADGSTLSEATFDPDQHTLVPASELSGVDRTMGYYDPTTNQTGLDLNLLIKGTDYPGVIVKGPTFNQNTGFDVGNFDINPLDNIDFGPEGLPTYSPFILDVAYDGGEYADSYLGSRPADINVSGGAFIDTYSSHAPEELVPSSIFDTLNMRIFTRPGFDYDEDGHGSASAVTNWTYTGSADTTTFSFAGLIRDPFSVRVYNVTTGVTLQFEYVIPAVHDVDYTVDWDNQTITLTGTNISVSDVIRIESCGIGGGNHLWVEHYSVDDLLINDSTDGIYIEIPVAFEEIYEAMIVCNGSRITNYTFSEINAHTTRITFGSQDMNGDSTPDSDLVKYFGTEPLETGDYLHVCVLGPVYNSAEYANTSDGSTDGSTVTFSVSPDYPMSDSGYITHDSTILQSSSYANSQFMQGDGSTRSFSISELDMQGHNPDTALVEINGVRLTPPEGLEFVGDGTSTSFYLDLTNWKGAEASFQTMISDNDVRVYVDYTALSLYADFVLSPRVSNDVRYVELAVAPAAGASIKIFVRTAADYAITYSQTPVSNSNVITFNTVPAEFSRIVITSDSNTREIDILNRVFKGPPISPDIGFNLGRIIIDSNRVRVTINGYRKYFGQNFNCTGSVITFSTTIAPADIVVVTMITENQVPEKLDFALFTDMRGNQAVYRIPSATKLVQAVTKSSDTIYVEDVSILSDPDLPNGIFGIIIIDGERITYRSKNSDNNSLTGLRRGTAGTGTNSHSVDALAYDYSLDNYLDYSYAKSWYAVPAINDGSTVTTGIALQNTSTVPVKFLKGA